MVLVLGRTIAVSHCRMPCYSGASRCLGRIKLGKHGASRGASLGACGVSNKLEKSQEEDRTESGSQDKEHWRSNTAFHPRHPPHLALDCHFVYPGIAFPPSSPPDNSHIFRRFPWFSRFSVRFWPASTIFLIFSHSRMPRRNTVVSRFVAFCPQESILSIALRLLPAGGLPILCM